MAVFTIPSDYDEITHPQTVPICIAETDAKGNLVCPVWIERGVMPVVDGLVSIAERVLLDKFRASEITEYAVHSLSRKYGENVGERPSKRVLNRARSHAEDLRAGGRRARRKLDVELFIETLESLEDQYDFFAAIEAKETLDIIVAKLDELGLDRVKKLLPYLLRNAEGQELTRKFDQTRNTITTRFYRGMRKAAKAAGLSWY